MTSLPLEKQGQHLLIVDDVAQNIQIVASMLKSDGYRLSFAQSGQMALRLVREENFDLVLLDIQMPGMDGYEVCARLKQDPLTESLPVIFLTANAGTEQTVQGFQLGAVDYLTKPVEPLELRARVRTHLELKHARDQIMHQNARLHALNQEKSELLRIVSHDLRTPLTVMVSGLDFVTSALGHTDARISRRLNNMRTATDRMEAIIHHFLSRDSILLGQRTLEIEMFPLEQALQAVLYHHQEWAQSKALSIELESEPDVMLCSDRGAIEQVLDNLLSNAIKFSPAQRQIFVRARVQDAAMLRLEIEDQGPGFTAEDQRRLFVETGRLSAEPTSGESSFGLGLSIVHRMVKLLQGEIQCFSQPGQGACFVLTLPRELPVLMP
ncbi:MAG: hybrid sensor histidine kinase/response regulator [Candidatus Sericytochromatia bacterium]